MKEKLRKIKGDVVALDIGRRSIKIVKANISGSSIVISKAVAVSQQERFIDQNGILKNIVQFATYIKKVLKENKISTEKLIVTTTAFDLKSSVKSLSHKNMAEMQIAFNSEYGRHKSNTKINDWQPYNNVLSEADDKMQYILSVGVIYSIKSLVEAFKDVELDIISVEENATASYNLTTFRKPNYDYPGQIIVDLGSTIKIYTGSNNAPATISEQGINMNQLVQALAKHYDVKPETAESWIFAGGAVEDAEALQNLNNAGMYKPNEYFEVVNSYFTNYFKFINNYIEQTKNALRLQNVIVTYTGGYANIPNLTQTYGYNQEEQNILDITNTLKTDTAVIKNVSKSRLSPVYGSCIGVLLKNNFKKTVNLIPSEIIVIRTDRMLKTGTLVATALSVIVAVACSISLASSAVTWSQGLELNTKLQEVSSKNVSLTATERDYKNYVTALTNIDGYISPLIDFIINNADSNICIASLDTKGMLPLGKVSQTAAPAVTGKGKDEQAVPPDTTPTVLKPRENSVMIVRGYSKDTKSITEFFASIGSQPFVHDAIVSGIEQVQLPSKEQVYIFEIEMSVK